MIYHDRLSQWWEVESQKYLGDVHNMQHRQWRSVGQTNDRVHQRYQNSLMGDSPELMPLDNSLFSDLVEGIGKHIVGTWAVTENDAKMTPFPLKEKFSMATPDEAWDTMVAVWSGSDYVMSERIIEDVEEWKRADGESISHALMRREALVDRVVQCGLREVCTRC